MAQELPAPNHDLHSVRDLEMSCAYCSMKTNPNDMGEGEEASQL